jgi:hypothetical protein
MFIRRHFFFYRKIKILFHLTVILISKKEISFFFLISSGYFVDVTIGHWSFVCVREHKFCDVQKTHSRISFGPGSQQKSRPADLCVCRLDILNRFGM